MFMEESDVVNEELVDMDEIEGEYRLFFSIFLDFFDDVLEDNGDDAELLFELLAVSARIDKSIEDSIDFLLLFEATN